ncbi:hypothetical protein [Brevibacillus dissolubilis]|uniref:hypothetical protein n=1 Tax=Brevibacillus dissolubilis TaxID=1844116 RepID=UPI0011166B2B|nr:hypothetical protein [Brevibacillus dissolubilis]
MQEHDQLPTKSEFLSTLETVKELSQNEFDIYSVVKEKATGQHYLRYHFIHYNLSEGGHRDAYDYFLPLDSDDVLSIVLGDAPYQYPEHWQKVYLRTGHDERLVYFDPTENFDIEGDAEEEQAILEALARYKQDFAAAEDKDAFTKEFFAKLEQLRKRG